MLRSGTVWIYGPGHRSRRKIMEDMYQGVPVPAHTDHWTSRDTAQWKDGVDAAQGVSPGQAPGGTLIRVHREDKPYLDVVSRVLAEDEAAARSLIHGLKPRDRALLSFFLQEVSRLVEDIETERRLS
jgi:hypothetical protein